jgi:hypothetical protein
MNQSDRADFRRFCEQASDAQLVNIVANERHGAERNDYRTTSAGIAEAVASARGLDISNGGGT